MNIEADIKTTAELDSGNLIIARTADVAPIVEDVKRIRSLTDGRSKTGDMVHVGRIPSIIVEQYLNTASITYHEFLIDNTHINRILNDPDYAAFRIWEGQV